MELNWIMIESEKVKLWKSKISNKTVLDSNNSVTLKNHKNGGNWIRGWIIYEIEAEWAYFHIKETEKEKELYILRYLKFS